jgi:uncharacterized iron-regulated protein
MVSRALVRMGSPLLAALWVQGSCALASSPPPPPGADCARAEAAARAQDTILEQGSDRLEVVLLGEIHTSAADHAWQLATVERLARRGRPLALGLEMVPAARQESLSRFASGQLDEAAFLAAVDWPAIWGHDPELYLPLLRWARRQGVPLLALNVEPSVVRRVRRDGLAAVPPAEREGIGTPVPAGAAYRERLRVAWQAHRPLSDRPGPQDDADVERFIASQLLRDRGMAERLVAARRRDPDRLVVVLLGRGHWEEEDGVPAQLRQLGLGAVAALERPVLPEECAPPPAGIRLGAFLESVDGAVWVRRVATGSAAAAGGLRPGDRLLAVNDEPVIRAGQVIRRVGAQPAGVPLRLTVARSGRTLRLELRLPAPAASMPGRMEALPARVKPATP